MNKRARKAPDGVHVVRRKLADGTTREYHYWGRGAGARRIEGEPYSPAYFEAVARLLDGKADSAPGKVGGLVSRYLASPAFRSLRPRTQADYRHYLGLILDQFGHYPIRAFEAKGARADIREWRDGMASKPRTADLAVAVLNVLLNWAVDAEELIRNPAARLKKIHDADRSDEVWGPWELLALVAAARPDARRAIVLAATTGLRRGDLCALPRSADEGTHLAVRTSKRGREVIIPLTRDARAIIDACPKVSPILLTTDAGRPWLPRHLSRQMQIARDRLGTRKRFHDLRGTAATRMIEAGMTVEDAARVLGWSVDRVQSIADRYVGARAFARAAVERLENAARKTPVKRDGAE